MTMPAPAPCVELEKGDPSCQEIGLRGQRQRPEGRANVDTLRARNWY